MRLFRAQTAPLGLPLRTLLHGYLFLISLSIHCIGDTAWRFPASKETQKASGQTASPMPSEYSQRQRERYSPHYAADRVNSYRYFDSPGSAYS